MSVLTEVLSGPRKVLVTWAVRFGYRPSVDDSDTDLEAHIIRHATDAQWQTMLRELRAEYAQSTF